MVIIVKQYYFITITSVLEDGDTGLGEATVPPMQVKLPDSMNQSYSIPQIHHSLVQ